jgi:hypothetical protein
VACNGIHLARACRHAGAHAEAHEHHSSMPSESRGFQARKGPSHVCLCLARHARRHLLTLPWCRAEMSSDAGAGEDDEQMKEYKEMMRQRYLAQNPPQDQAPPPPEAPATATATATTPDAAAGAAPDPADQVREYQEMMRARHAAAAAPAPAPAQPTPAPAPSPSPPSATTPTTGTTAPAAAASLSQESNASQPSRPPQAQQAPQPPQPQVPRQQFELPPQVANSLTETQRALLLEAMYVHQNP